MKQILCIVLIATSLNAFAQGQFRVRNDSYIQIGYTGYKALTFGQETNTPNNGKFAIEYCGTCSPAGFNFWKPWPTPGAANYLLFIRDNGNVGIGNSGDATRKLSVNGSVLATAYHSTSDKRLKENINPIQSPLSKLLTLQSFSYKFKQSNESPAMDSMAVNIEKRLYEVRHDHSTHFGLMAQDLEIVFPELVTSDENGFLSINYIEIIPVLIEAIKEQQKELVELRTLISSKK